MLVTYRKIGILCAKGVLFCGRQFIALRGDKEALNQTGNLGSFLKVLADHDPLLKSHLQHRRMRNATYVSPMTQNAIIQDSKK